MYQAIFRSLLLAITLALLPACDTITEKVEERSKLDQLQNTINSYSKSIRWGYFDQAYSFRKYEKGEFPDPPANLAEVRVSAYDVLQPPTMLDENIAVQVVAITYYYIDTQILRTIRDKQMWVYDETARRWYLDTPIPKF